MLQFLEKFPTEPGPSSTQHQVCQCNDFMDDSGVFQTTASVLELRVSEFWHKSFKCGVSVSYSPSNLLDASPAGFQSQI